MNRTIDDNFLFAHMGNAENFMLDSIPPEIELDHTFSRRFLRKMKSLLKYERRSPTMRSFVHYSKTAAAILLIFLSIVFTTTMSVEAYRVRFFEFVTTVWEELTSFIIHSDDNADYDRLTPIESTYIPQGYKVLEHENSQYKNIIIYADADGNEIYYAQELATQSEFIFDSENTDTDMVEIGDYTVYQLQNKGTAQLYWYDEFYVYSLIGGLEKSELIKMAESIMTK